MDDNNRNNNALGDGVVDVGNRFLEDAKTRISEIRVPTFLPSSANFDASSNEFVESAKRWELEQSAKIWDAVDALIELGKRALFGGEKIEFSNATEKATSALELAKTENESLRAKLKEEKTLKTTTTKKKKTKKKETEQKRRRRERLRTTTPLPETPPFAKQFWSYRNDERRRLHEENKVHHHPLQFSDSDDDDSDSDDDDDFYSDEDTSSEEKSSSSSSSESSSSSSSEEYDDEEEEYQRDATNNTSYSSIDELLDRSVVLNSRLEALERRARNLVAIENAKPSAKADRDDTTE